MRTATFVEEALPELDPVIAHETTAYGWRGLTAQGEVLEVKPSDGQPISVPDEIVVACLGVPVGRRAVRNDNVLDIEQYLTFFNRTVELYKQNQPEIALLASQSTLSIARTVRATFNHSMILLALGRWHEGMSIYWHCEQRAPFMRPQAAEAFDNGMQPWRGEDLRGKRLLLLHAHGFGDTLMMLRYLPALKAMGANVVMVMPPELVRITDKSGIVIDRQVEADYFCPILHLLFLLDVSPASIDARPYLAVDHALVRQRRVLAHRKKVGIAWSIGKPSDGDYPRQIPLAELVAAFDPGEIELHSVQTQGADEARALGVQVHEFKDFADCAALMLNMDEIVSVDTAALHLAGAIGHPRVFGLLSHWASWRWVARWYENVKLCRQSKPGDWKSALAQIHQS